MGDLSAILSIASFVLVLCGLIGGWIALHSGLSRTATEIQERVKTGLLEENELLQRRINRLEEVNKQFAAQVALVTEILAKRGIHIVIDGDIITVKNGGESSGKAHRALPRAKLPAKEQKGPSAP